MKSQEAWACLLWMCVAWASRVVEAQDSLSLSLQVNGTEVEEVDVTEGRSVLLTLIIHQSLPQDAQEFLLQEISPDSFGHVELVPARLSLDLTTGDDDDFAGQVGLTADGDVAATFNMTGVFLGFTKMQLSVVSDEGHILLTSHQYTVKVQRSDKLLDKVFTVAVITLVSIVYINMGCAIDLDIIINTLKKPVAPLIGLASQYLFMPLTSYGLGYLLFSDTTSLWLGMFLVGCSPGGGGSNIWTYLLGGSLDLSVTMTFVSTVAAFAALPIWVYALAASIYNEGNFKTLPYGTMAGMVTGLLLPCALGILIRRYLPKVAHVLKKMLTPIAVIFVIFFSTFGVYVNFYIFYYFTWKVVMAGMALPCLGYSFGGLMAWVCRRPWQEVVAISVETGIQNTGLAIGVIKLALEEYSPLGDVTVVVPVGVATLTAVPLLLALVVRKVYLRYSLHGHDGPLHSSDPGNLKMTPATSQTPLHTDVK